jgi:hypothetical protein
MRQATVAPMTSTDEEAEAETVSVTRKGHRLLRMVRTGNAVEPRTLVGRQLRAAVLRRADERERLYRELEKTGSVDADSVTRAAFDVAVRRRFRRGVDLRDVSAFVANMRAAFGEDFPVLETEAMIRHGLGEDVPVNDIAVSMEIAAKLRTIGSACDSLNLGETEVSAMLVEAEDVARQRGFHPTPAGQQS